MFHIPKIQKYIAAFLIVVQIGSSLSSYSSAEESVPAVPREDISVDQDIHSDMDILLRERALYDSENLTREDVTVFQTESDLIGPSYMIREKSEIYGQVGKTRITSELLERTLVQNALRTSVDPSTLSIAPARAEKTLSARAKFLLGKSLASPEKAEVLTFEFGIEDTHLIFSEPVRLSVDTPDIPDGTEITLSVLHAGDPDWNTSGLMTDSRGSCLPDGSASVPATRAFVSGGKVEFFTCGASTFSLGYVPGVDFPNNTVWSTSLDAAGKLILAGAFTTVAGVARNRVARVDASGALDTTFADPNVNNIVYASAVQGDGKILIGGAFTGVTGTGRNLLARLNSDGTLDATFNANITFVAGNQVRAIAIQSDGKILIGGIFTVVGGVARNRIARLNTDGTLDLTYNPNANNAVYAITLQPDGKALIGGAFTNVVATARNRLARINTGGTLDATWNPNSNNTVWDIELFSDNTVALAGQFTTMGGVARNRIAKVSALGALDLAYNPNVNNTVFALTVESNNNLILGGQFTTVTAIARNRIARLTSTGVLDGTFNPNASNTVYTLTKKLDSTIAIGGAFTTVYNVANSYITYAFPTGLLDSRYNLRTNSTVWSVSSYSVNRVILAGAFTTVAGVARNRVARVDASGALDTTFADPNVNNIVYASAVQGDGKILIGGAFTGVTGTGRNLLARLNSDGTLDAAFNANITFVAGNQVRAIAIQSDGKILIGGVFTVVGGVARNRIARLNTDGTLDLTYNPNANNAVYAITLQPDGKALIGGAFTNVVATARNRLARINTGGTLDATWNPNSNNTIWDIELFSDNTVALAGQFTTMGGVARNRIAKVSALGALDLAYNPNVNNTVFALTVESNNNLILGGQFTTVTAIGRNRIARLTSTGVLDGTFNPNANNIVYTLAKDTDGNLLAGGTFTTLGTKSVPFFSWIGLAIPDTTPPVIISTSLGSGMLLPIGNFSVTTAYTDTGAGINTAGVSVTLERWSGALWGADIAPTYLSGSASITTSTGIHTFQGVPYGKYRYRMNVPDISGNTSMIERIFYIDAIDWVVSQPTVAIGNISPLIGQYSAPSELTITVETVGVPFDLFLSGSLMAYSGTTISHWTGTGGYGYEKYASGYTNSLSSLASGWVNIASQTGAINTNGDKNIYTYRIQYGALVGADQEAGDYQALVGMRINLGY